MRVGPGCSRRALCGHGLPASACARRRTAARCDSRPRDRLGLGHCARDSTGRPPVTLDPGHCQQWAALLCSRDGSLDALQRSAAAVVQAEDMRIQNGSLLTSGGRHAGRNAILAVVTLTVTKWRFLQSVRPYGRLKAHHSAECMERFALDVQSPRRWTQSSRARRRLAQHSVAGAGSVCSPLLDAAPSPPAPTASKTAAGELCEPRRSRAGKYRCLMLILRLGHQDACFQYVRNPSSNRQHSRSHSEVAVSGQLHAEDSAVHTHCCRNPRT